MNWTLIFYIFLIGIFNTSAVVRIPQPLQKKRQEYQKHVRRQSPLIARSLKKTTLLSLASESSGALKWAHEQGTRGQGIKGVIVEFGQQVFDEDAFMGIFGDKTEKTQHNKDVRNIMREIAPDARLRSLPLKEWDDPVSSMKQDSIKEKIRAAKVVNYSMGFDSKKTISPLYLQAFYYNQTIDALSVGVDKLVVMSAGNEGDDLSDTHLKFSIIPNHVIIAGALTQRKGIAEFSNIPGADVRIQKHTLFALGADVIVNPYTAKSRSIEGTSFSAPIISGAGLLIYSAHPHFKAKDVKEVLLESADRSFFQRSNADNGHTEYYYYDPDDGTMAVDSMGPYVLVRPFDPKRMGKGILNIRNALIYAKIKAANPAGTPKQLRKAMKRIIKKENNAAARKIQRAFRYYKQYKKKNS